MFFLLYFCTTVVFAQHSITEKTVDDLIREESALTIREEDAVAVGYDTQLRKNIIGSVSTVSSKQLKNIPVTSVLQVIQGKIAGVHITQTEGAPGAEIIVNVRGVSLTLDKSPLYIVDGFPVDDLSSILPADIEFISVLKDASATAIYGMRGANGVVIITTKSGSEGRVTVSYNMYYGLKKNTKWHDVMNPYDYVKWQLEVCNFAGTSGMDTFYDMYGAPSNISIYEGIPGTNWQKEIMGEIGRTWNHNLTVSGGIKAFRFNVGFTRNDDTDVMITNGFKKTGLIAKLNSDVNKWLSFDANIRLTDQTVLGAGTNTGIMLNYLRYCPTNGLSDFSDDENYKIEDQYPLLNVKDTYQRRPAKTSNYNGAFNIKFLDHFVYRFQIGYQHTKELDKRFWGMNTGIAVSNSNRPVTERKRNNSTRWNGTQTLTFSKNDFLAPGHHVSLMAGHEISHSKRKWYTKRRRYFPETISPEDAFANPSLSTPYTEWAFSDTSNKLSSFFGRMFYDYRDKYLLTYVIRTEGSKIFAPGNRWGTFTSGGVSWRISSEDFMEATKSWLSDLRLKFSLGQSGNNRVSNRLLPGTTLPNLKLKWETATTRNLGLDFSLWKYRLNGMVDFYHHTTSDLLMQVAIPPTDRYTTQIQNVGQISNRGIEITLNGEIIEIGDFRLSGNFNIAFNRNKIDQLREEKRWIQGTNLLGNQADYLIEEGGKVGRMYGYQTDPNNNGMYSFDDFNVNADGTHGALKPGIANNYSVLDPKGGMMPGVLKFVKQPKADGEEITNWNINDDDKIIIGDANPKHTGGFGITAQYKGFDFLAYFNWSYGNDIYNANKLATTNFIDAQFHDNLSGIMRDRFYMFDESTGIRIRDMEQLKEMNKDKTMWIASNGLAPLHSWVIEDGSFLRLNNMTLGYSIPQKLLDKLRIKQLRIYITGYNLWIWTNYSGYDPEASMIFGASYTPGVDWNAYPKSRSFSVGLNLTF